MLERRLEVIRAALGARGRWLRGPTAGRSQAAAVHGLRPGRDRGRDGARAGSANAADDPAWAAALATGAFCLDDFLELWSGAGDADAFRAGRRRRQVARMRDLHHRLEGFVDHSSHDRRHLLTDLEASATDEAADLLGGIRPD